jgi:hypothetical protein
MIRKILWVTIALSAATNVYLALLLLNGGFELDDARSVAEQLLKRREVVLEILKRDWVGRPVASVDKLAADLKRKGVVVGVEGKEREIGDFLFEIKDGIVIDVRDLDSQSR